MLKPISASFPAALRARDERYGHDTVAAKTALQATRARIAAMAALVALAGCAEKQTIAGHTYEPYGLLNADDKKNPDVAYEVKWSGVVGAVVFCELIIPPIYVFGFDLFEPVGMKTGVKGEVAQRPNP